MDRSLDEIIDERPRDDRRAEPRRANAPPPRGPRAPRREEYPRDGVRKYRTEDTSNIDSDWVHDRFEEDRYDKFHRGAPRDDRNAPGARAAETNGGTKIRVDNVHYDLTEDDLRELFERVGPTVSVKLLYDRMDRSQGTAFVTYSDPRDAKDAMRQFDGQNANGQAIKLSVLPTGPAVQTRPAQGGSLFDRIERPPRSLFDRIEGGAAMARRDHSRGDSREDTRRRRRDRSDSPRKTRPIPDHIDRYTPGQRGSRSPIRPRGPPRETGRRPGARREESGRGGERGGRRGRTDEEGRPLIGGRLKKSAEELDAEMADYWGKSGEDQTKTNGDNSTQNGSGAGRSATAADHDIDMIE